MEIIFSAETITCCHEGCGIVFAVPDWWEKKRREDRTFWYCPNGHSQHFTGDTEADKLRRERDRLNQQLAQRDDAIRAERDARHAVERSLTATRAVVTRTKNRVAHGVCPCCKRSFDDLRRHMASKHAGYGAKTEQS